MNARAQRDEITRELLVRQVMRKNSVSFSVAKDFVNQALKQIEARLRQNAATAAVEAQNALDA